MAKELLFKEEGRRKILSGIEKLSNAVKVTLGPKGRNVVIGKKFGLPLITKDGVTVAKEIVLEDPFENIGAQMVKEVAENTSDIAGDGTTTATILTEAIFREGLKNVTAGANPMALKRGIEKAVERVVEKLKEFSMPIKDKKEIAQVASIASNSDKVIGDLIADAMDKVGKDGVITVEEAKSITTTLDVVEGMQFEQGYLSPHFVTDNQRMEVVLENPCILLHEKKINNLKDFLPLLEQVVQSRRPLLVIAEDVEGEALVTLVVNKLRGILPVCAVKSPGFGEKRRSMLEDLAILTGGKVISDDLGVTLASATITDLGSAKKVKISNGLTTIVEGLGVTEQITERVNQIKSQIESESSDYKKDQLKERLAKLSGGVAVISVGATTETEMKEKKARVEDSLHATRAAVEEGIVPGGGVALLRIASELDSLVTEDSEETVGVNIIKRALEEPIRQLASNAGLEGSVIIREVLLSSKNIGCDISNGTYVDMFEAGIVDPTKVTRSALQNASSIASLLLTTEAVITDKPEKESSNAAQNPGMGLY